MTESPYWRKPMLMRSVVLVLVAAATPSVLAAGLLTIKEGNVWALRGTGWYAFDRGVAVEDGDAIEATDKALAQVELGPSTRVQAVGPAGVYVAGVREAQGESLPEIGVASGWVKVAHAGGAGLRLRAGDTPLTLGDAVVVVHVRRGVAELFVESGTVKAPPASPEAKGGTAELKSGTFAAFGAPGKGATAPRNRAAFIAEMPRIFRDALPPLASRIKGPPPAPILLGDVSFAEAQPWLAGPYQSEFQRRLAPRLADPAFREAAKPYLSKWPEARRTPVPAAAAR